MDGIKTLTLACLFGVTSAQADQFHGPLKILELNFNSEEALNDSDFAIRDLRYNAIIRWVEDNSPDVILFAEAWSYRGGQNITEALAQAIGYDYAYRIEMGFPGMFYSADGILAKKEFRLSNERDLLLPHSAPEIGDGKTWVIEFGPVSYAVGAKLTLDNGEPLYVYTTHLVASSDEEHADQAGAILDDVKSWVQADGLDWEKTHVILGGDYNTPTEGLATQAVLRAGFLDSFAVAHPGDTSCSDCGQPESPWFNPFSISPGLFPSQADNDTDMRDDYIFSHSPSLKPLSSTLIFTAPYRGVWMSDHYGIVSVFGDETLAPPPNPIHDSDGTEPDSQIITITNDSLRCPSSPDDPSNDWNEIVDGDNSTTCRINLADTLVYGARGITVSNRSDFYLRVRIDGPGTIYDSHNAGLGSGDRASFNFDTTGEFAYSITSDSAIDLYRSKLLGKTIVLRSGY